MIPSKWRKRLWFAKLLLGTTVGFGSVSGFLYAQDRPTTRVHIPSATVTVVKDVPAMPVEPHPMPSGEYITEAPSCDPCAPISYPPICRVPNFLGDFFARGLQGCQTTPGRTIVTTTPLAFNGTGVEGFRGEARGAASPFLILAPITMTGPGGPYTLTQDIPYDGNSTFTLTENAEFTPLVQGNFAGATFVDGGGTRRSDPQTETTLLDIFYNYLFTTRQITPDTTICVNIPNPSGGGLVGRNKYFENGSPIPRDRVFFDYRRVDDYRGLGTRFDINRYVFGAEKTFWKGRMSAEVFVPFAGTANSTQTAGQGLAVDHLEFGNVGLVVKGSVYRTDNFLASAGLGFSFPTADDSRILVNGQPILEVHNRAVLLQPIFGAAWAPNDRLYAQGGVQFDFDPTGNPVRTFDANGNRVRLGSLRDSRYAFVSGALGYWVYQNDCRTINGLALQSELHYNASMGNARTIRSGNFDIGSLTNQVDVLNGTTGVIANVGKNGSLSVGVSTPLAGDRQYDWTLITQLGYRF